MNTFRISCQINMDICLVFLGLVCSTLAGSLQKDAAINRCLDVARPDLEPCIIELIKDLKPSFEHGLPDLGLPSLKEISVTGFSVNNYEDKYRPPKNMELSANMDITARGFEKADLTYLNVDDQSKVATWKIFVPQLDVELSYAVDGKVYVPIKGHGDMLASLKRVVMKGEGWLDAKQGQENLKIKAKVTRIDAEDVEIPVSKFYEDNLVLQSLMQLTMDASGQTLFRYVKPALKRNLSRVITDIGNQVVANIKTTSN